MYFYLPWSKSCLDNDGGLDLSAVCYLVPRFPFTLIGCLDCGYTMFVTFTFLCDWISYLLNCYCKVCGFTLAFCDLWWFFSVIVLYKYWTWSYRAVWHSELTCLSQVSIIFHYHLNRSDVKLDYLKTHNVWFYGSLNVRTGIHFPQLFFSWSFWATVWFGNIFERCVSFYDCYSLLFCFSFFFCGQ